MTCWIKISQPNFVGMKDASLIALLLLLSFTLDAQNDGELAPVLNDTFAIGAELQSPERIVYEMFDIEKPPVYPGGTKELLKYLAENIKYPPMNRDSNIISMIAVTFVVEPDGSISSKKVLRGIELATSVLEVIDRMPRWTPGMKNGQPVPVRFTLPIRLFLRE